jgi:hypothetical protein
MTDTPHVAIDSRSPEALAERAAQIRAKRERTLAMTQGERAAERALRRIERTPEADRPALAPGTPLAEWEDQFLEGVRAGGTIRAGCTLAGIPRADAELCYTTNTRFRDLVELAFRDYAEGLHLIADDMARKGDGAMMRAMLAAHMPQKFGKQSTQIVITQADQKKIDAIARAAGVDPKLVLDTVFEVVNTQKAGGDRQ